MFNEDNTTEQMIISTLCKNGWTYIAPENLPRHPNDVMVESMRASLNQLLSHKLIS